MVGVLVVTHCGLARELVKTAEFIVGSLVKTRTLSLDSDMDPDTLRNQIETAIDELDEGQGVLILVDMLGGTPSNLTLPFLDPNRVEVVSGVNLPMLLKIAKRSDHSLKAIADEVLTAGQRSIALASSILYNNSNQRVQS